MRGDFRVRSAFKEGKASDWKQDAKPRSDQELRAILRHIETNLPAHIHLIVGNHATHKHPRSRLCSPDVRAGTFNSHQPMLPAWTRSNASSRYHPSRPSGTSDVVKKQQPIRAYNAIARPFMPSCELLTRAPLPRTSRLFGEFPERSCVAGTKTEERRRRIVAQYDIWRMRLRALKATVTRRSRKGTSHLWSKR